MENLTLRQLRYLQAVAETGHFGRAARRCNVSQPALSMQIRQLEDNLGVTLFDRGASGAALTPQGGEILARARDILARTRDLVETARLGHEPLCGELRLGVIPTIAPYLLPATLPELARRYPRLRLHLRETQTSNLLDELASGRLDLALAALPLDVAELEEKVLFEDPFWLAVPAGHALAGRKTVDIGDIEPETVLLLEEGHCFRDQALSVCRQVNPAVIDEFGATSFATILQMVAFGFGVTFVPGLATNMETAARDSVKLLPFAPPAPSRTVGLIWRKSSPRSIDFEALGDLLTQVARASGTVG